MRRGSSGLPIKTARKRKKGNREKKVRKENKLRRRNREKVGRYQRSHADRPARNKTRNTNKKPKISNRFSARTKTTCYP